MFAAHKGGWITAYSTLPMASYPPPHRSIKTYVSQSFSCATMTWLHLTRITIVAILLVAEKVAFIAPNNPGPKEEEMAKYGRADTATRIATWFPVFSLVSRCYAHSTGTEAHTCEMQAVDYACHLCEIFALLAREFPSPLSNQVLSMLFTDPSAVDRLSLSPIFLTGVVLLVVGAMMRQACYDTLGKFFTFQLAVFKGHKLVTTGPYSLVRHPSYMAFLVARAELFVVQVFPGSYVCKSGLLAGEWSMIGIGIWEAWILSLVFEIVVLQVLREDAVLKKEFGTEWEAWAKKTPYRLIPYIY